MYTHIALSLCTHILTVAVYGPTETGQCVYTFFWRTLCVYIYMCEYIYVCVYMCVYMCVYVCICVYVHVHVYVCVCMCVCKGGCVRG